MAEHLFLLHPSNWYWFKPLKNIDINIHGNSKVHNFEVVLLQVMAKARHYSYI